MKKSTVALIVVIILLLGLLVGATGLLLRQVSKVNEQAALLQRKDLLLTEKDKAVQQLNTDLGIAKSELLTKQELNKKYENDIDLLSKDLKELVHKHSLELKSRDNTIARLKAKTKGGTTTVVVKGPKKECDSCKVAEGQSLEYTWTDPLKRFTLLDPDVFTQGNESFTQTQHFRLTGHVFEAKSGQLQVRQVKLREVTERDGDWVEIPGSQVEVVDAKFDYSNDVQLDVPGLLDIFTFRPQATFDIRLQPGLALELVNFGRFAKWVNIGISPNLSFDTSDVLNGSLGNSRFGVLLSYHLLPPILDTNFAIFTGVQWLFNDLSSPGITLGISLYLTQDLNPFSFWKERPKILGIQL